MSDYLCSYDSPLGSVTIASDGEAIVGLWFEGQKHFAASLREASMSDDISVLKAAQTWLDCYFEGNKPITDMPLKPRGSAFQQLVWNQLLKIPYGHMVTYGEIARRIELEDGHHTSPRAVGSAVGRNPISVIIPCHRVVGASGALTGFAGGLDKKMVLLRTEDIEIDEEAQRVRIALR